MCNEAHVNAMIVEKRNQLLKKLERKMRKLNHPRAVELAKIMQRMLRDSEKEFLTQDHIELRDFNLSNELVQVFANSQTRTGEDFYQKNNPA